VLLNPIDRSINLLQKKSKVGQQGFVISAEFVATTLHFTSASSINHSPSEVRSATVCNSLQSTTNSLAHSLVFTRKTRTPCTL